MTSADSDPCKGDRTHLVMAALVAGIHLFCRGKVVAGRDQSDHHDSGNFRNACQYVGRDHIGRAGTSPIKRKCQAQRRCDSCGMRWGWSQIGLPQRQAVAWSARAASILAISILPIVIIASIARFAAA